MDSVYVLQNMDHVLPVQSSPVQPSPGFTTCQQAKLFLSTNTFSTLLSQLENLLWYKNTKLLQTTQKGRIRVVNVAWVDNNEKSSTKGKRIGWNSTLSIFQPQERDSGIYSFMVSFAKTNYTIERTVKVTKISSGNSLALPT